MILPKSMKVGVEVTLLFLAISYCSSCSFIPAGVMAKACWLSSMPDMTSW